MRLAHMAALCTVAAAACSGERLLSAVFDAVAIETTQTSYVRGAEIVGTVEDRSTRTVFVSPCFLDLQVREATAWRTVAARGCIDFDLKDFRELRPGQALRDTMPTAIAWPAGQYRLVFDIRIARAAITDGAYPKTVSNTFSVE